MTTPRKRSTTKTKPRPMPAESWGWKMKRAREAVARLTLTEAVDELGRYQRIDGSTISRLEHLLEAPNTGAGRRQRTTAFLLVTIYGLDPAEFDLSEDDVPEATLYALRDLGIPPTRWYDDPSPGRLTTHSASAA